VTARPARPKLVAAAVALPFRNLESGTDLPARSARPQDHPQVIPELAPQHAFRNDCTEPTSVRGPTAAAPRPTAFRPVEPGDMTDGRPVKRNGLRGGLPSPALPGSGPWGSPFSLSAARPLSRPVATPVTRRLVRSSSLDHLADDTHAARRRRRAPRAESPGVHRPNVMSPAQAKAAGGPIPGAPVRRSWPPARLSPRGLTGQRVFMPSGWVRLQDCSLAVAVSGLSRIDRFLDSHAVCGEALWRLRLPAVRSGTS
jgi:hypothetical protein